MLHREIDAATVAQELTTDSPVGQEMDARLSSLRTTLGTIERAITKYEDFLKDCRMQEEQAHQVETSPEEPEEETTDMEMADDEGRDDPEPSDPRKEANMEVLPPLLKDMGPTPPVPSGDVISLPRRMPSSCSQHHNLKVQLLDLIAPGVRSV